MENKTCPSSITTLSHLDTPYGPEPFLADQAAGITHFMRYASTNTLIKQTMLADTRKN